MTSARAIERALDRQAARADRYGGAWRPQFARTVGAPPPLPGEAFSSWLWRTACRLHVAMETLLRSWGLWPAVFWIDSGHAPFRAEPVAAALGVDPGGLRAFEGPQGSDLALAGLACLTTEPLFRRPIYRYCAACLNGDAVPHFRQAWRLASGYLCPAYRLVLRDRCPACGARLDLSHWPIRQTRRGASDQGLRYCPACRRDLGAAPPVTLPDGLETLVLARQAEMAAWVADLLPIRPGPFEALAGLERSAEGVLDPYSSFNALALRAGLGALCGGWEREDEARARLRDRIRVVRGGPGDGPALAAALDGQRLFGGAAASLGFHLRHSGTLTGGTFWNPSEEAWTDDRAAGFAAAEVRAALAWVEQRQPSMRPRATGLLSGRASIAAGRMRLLKPSI